MAEEIKIEYISAEDLLPNGRNFRLHPDRQKSAVLKSLEEFGFVSPVIANKRGCEPGKYRLTDGHLRRDLKAGEKIPVVVVDWPEEKERRFLLSFDRTTALAEEDEVQLAKLMASLAEEERVAIPAFEDEEIGRLLAAMDGDASPGGADPELAATLADRFLVPPFSVLDARQGYWQDRKRAWLSLGMESELGRGGEPGLNPQAEDQATDSKNTRERERERVSPGGSPRPAMKLKDGHAVRGDGRGRAIE